MLSTFKNSKQRKASEFWEKKEAAFRLYGKPSTRPQQSFRAYLNSRRRLNLGIDVRENDRTEEIMEWAASDIRIFPIVSINFQNLKQDVTWKFIETGHDFKGMLEKMNGCEEIALDLECNNDHSYLGMTALIQIGTHSQSYLLDPYSMYDEICQQLNGLMINSTVTKVMFGCDNDVISWNRDFNCNLTAVIDVQQVHLAMSIRIYELLTNKNPVILKIYQRFPTWLSRMLGLDPTQECSPIQIDECRRRSTMKMSLSDVTKIYFPDILVKSNVATYADWRIRPLENTELVSYALFDVNALLKIWQRMKKLLLEFELFTGCLAIGIAETKKLQMKYFQVKIKPATTLQISDVRIKSLTDEQRSKLQMLFKFRELHAKLVDEPESEVFSDSEAIQMVKLQNPNTSNLQLLVACNRKFPPECIESMLKPAFRILTEGLKFYDEMMTLGKCHVCLGKFQYPHLAWGCVEKYSQTAVNRFMNQEQNSHYQEKKNKRRLENWRRKYGDTPCPYLKNTN